MSFSFIITKFDSVFQENYQVPLVGKPSVCHNRRLSHKSKILKELREIFFSVCCDFDAQLIEFDGEKDHVHLLVNYPPHVALSKLVNSLKGVSSRLIRKKNYPIVLKALWRNALWSPSYFAGSCGGAPLEFVKPYIQQQQTPKQPCALHPAHEWAGFTARWIKRILSITKRALYS